MNLRRTYPIVEEEQRSRGRLVPAISHAVILVLRTTYQINNPFNHTKQKSSNPVQNSPAIKPAQSTSTFRMSFFERIDITLEISFGILFSGHIINRLVTSVQVEKSRRKNRKDVWEFKCELESSCFSNSLFSTTLLVAIRYKSALRANICSLEVFISCLKFCW